ncbi:MAG: L-threonylcarbamoyladenylate synthase, partial [Planctomycetota bacterium]
MKTTLIQSTSEAAELLHAGKLVAFPTETVFGLGVDATSDDGVRRLFDAKGRPGSNPLIVHVSDASQWSQVAASLTSIAEALLAAFAPGPLTVVLPKRAEISSLVTAGLDTVGLRVPDHPVAQEILQLAGIPIAAPSANRSGRPSGTRWRTVLEDLEGRVDAVFQQDGPSLGLESTVVDCTGLTATVLRPGAVTFEQIRRILPEASDYAPTAENSDTTDVRSPGTLHPHYQPRAEVRLVDSPDSIVLASGDRSAYCGLQAVDDASQFALACVFETIDDYAAGFYEFLREADRQSVSLVYVQLAPGEGIGQA